ncbi:MAG: hypothetical protein AAGU19_02475 [Prolixibacteraceae bacterium]
MRTFISKVVVFLVVAALSIEVGSAILIFTDLYLIGYPGRDVYHSIDKSKDKKKSKKLLLGDSVGQQLFSNKTNNDTINSLACNQAIGVVGQYLLLSNYLKAGNNVDTVFMIFAPSSFKNNLDQRFTYHYFLKPFDTPEYSALFTPTVKEQIGKIPYHQYSKVPHIYATSWAPDFVPSDTADFSFLSPVSAEYLARMKELSVRHNFRLIILPTPTKINKKQWLDTIDKKEIQAYGLNKEFADYFEKIIYLDSTHFIDDTHLIHPEKYTQVYKKQLLR